jgi:GNAT superfamily N-acetyltransferase
MIRHLEIADIPDLIDLAYEMHQESIFRNKHFSPVKMAQLFHTAMMQDSVFFCMVGEIDGKVVGGMLGHLSQYFFGNDFMAADIGLFVKKEHRGSSVGIKLIKAFESWAKEHGAKEVNIIQSTGVEVEKTTHLMERLGYTNCGSTMKKEI